MSDDISRVGGHTVAGLGWGTGLLPLLKSSPPPGCLIYQANGSNAKPMAPMCAESSDDEWRVWAQGGEEHAASSEAGTT